MQCVQFGNTEMNVSRLCLGTMTFSRKLDLDASRQVVDEALDRGINFIDTAESYDDSEEFLGQILQGRRDKIYLATKIFRQRAGEQHGRNSRENITHSLERSLRLLKTDRVDLYQLHHPDPETPLDETLATLDAFVKQGKIRYVGVCNHYAWQMATMIERAQRFEFDPIISIQARYNILDRAIEMEMVPMAMRYNLAMMAYAPLGSGLLSGKYKRGEPVPPGSRGTEDTKLQKTLTNPKVFDAIDQLNEIARRNNVTLTQLAILWILAKPYLTTPIVGGSKPEHFRMIYDIADKRLPDTDISEVDELSAGFIYREFQNQAMKEGAPLA
ncbi:MAG TPA: aldo/keto reductase [Tepidisphaeraceae bacterium]|nr:aldo/keto reductase [Tepidisphaeraceae bacterium]